MKIDPLLSAAPTVPTSRRLTVPPVEQTTPGATAAASASNFFDRGATAQMAQMALLLPEQARLAQLWASALDIDVNEIRADDTFFGLGGDSLSATRVLREAEQGLGLRLDPRRLCRESLAQLAGTSALDGTAARGLLGRVFGGWARTH